MAPVIRILVLAILLCSGPALADAPLVFAAPADDLRVRQMADFLTGQKALNPSLPYDIAAIDLNNDGVDEAIFRQISPQCLDRADCAFLITGLSRKTPVLLGQIRARKIGMDAGKSYGVRRLLVYNSPDNDFAYQTWGWNPYENRFKAQ